MLRRDRGPDEGRSIFPRGVGMGVTVAMEPLCCGCVGVWGEERGGPGVPFRPARGSTVLGCALDGLAERRLGIGAALGDVGETGAELSRDHRGSRSAEG